MGIPATLRSRKTMVSGLIKPYRPYGPARPDKKRPSRQVLARDSASSPGRTAKRIIPII
jgi:hypothetical protein